MSDETKRLYISGVKHNSKTDIIDMLANHLNLETDKITVNRWGTTAIAEFPSSADEGEKLDEALYQLRRDGLLAQIFHR